MEFGLLGPLLIRRDDGGLVELGAPKQRALLIHLLLQVGQTLSADRLVDALWGEDPPPKARVTLRSYLSSLRRALDEPSGEGLIVTTGTGYRLQTAPESVDAVRFERLANAAARRLTAGDAQSALEGVEEALKLWRGEALADLAGSLLAQGERTRLEELRLSAHEDRLDALLALGRHAEAVASAEAFTAAEPLRERARAQLMLALYRSGRAPDALGAFTQFRTALIDELGLDPSPQLQALADRILTQDRDLDLPAADVPPRRSPPRPEGTPAPSPLVGRVHERRELQACVNRLLAGEGDLLLVSGEPGIGKTSLLEELGRLGGAAGAVVHWGRCHETRGAPAFWPWIQILRGIAAACDDEALRTLASGAARPVTQLVDDIGDRLGQERIVVGDDLEAARFQLYDAIATFLVRAGAQRPLVLLLDDLHWADTPSLQTLAFLTPMLASGSVLVTGAYRDLPAEWADELEATLATVVRESTTQQLGLTGLQLSAVAELAERLTGAPLGGDELELLHHRTAGNPFFVRQLSQLLAESDAVPGSTPIPTGVRHVIARRLHMLPAEVREVLEVAAVVGAQFDLRLLAASAGTTPSAALEAAGRAAAHGLLEASKHPGAGYRFVHALVRETIYDSLPPERTARLHAQVADAMEALPNAVAAELAEHYWRAVALVPDGRPVRALVTAADDALAVLAYEQAETYLRRALELLAGRGNDPTSELRVRVQLVQLLVSLHGWATDAVEEITAPARQLVRHGGLAPGMAPLWSALLSSYISRGDLRTAEELARELLDRADDDPGALAAGHSALAYVSLAFGRDPAEARKHAAEAECHADRAAPEELQAVPHIGVAAIYMQALALAYLGRAAEAKDAALRSVPLAVRAADPLSQAIAYMVAGSVGVLVRDPAFVITMTAPGLRLCDRHGYRSVSSFTTVSDSWARARLGEDPARHAAAMKRAIDAIQQLGHADPLASYLLFTAETYLLADDTAAARRSLAEAHELSRRTGEAMPAERLKRVEAGLVSDAAEHPEATG